jgi:hypothetical protein
MMRSLFENKRLILLLAALALVALTVLAVSLNEVSFRTGERFSRTEAVEVQFSPADVARAWTGIPVWKQLIVWMMIALLVILIGLLLSPEFRKRLFLLFVRSALTFWGIYYLLRNYGEQIFAFLVPPEIVEIQPNETSVTPLPVFQPPQVSPTLSYLISFAFALLCLAVIWGLYRGWQKYTALNTKKSLDDIARIARSSLNDLASGRDSSDVIINCYLRMSDVVSDKRQLRRADATTPNEFALRLEQAGLPSDAVKRLTRLFEVVRYGDRKSGPKDVNEAISCLKTILHYCGEAV